jgi:hypothetical protein
MEKTLYIHLGPPKTGTSAIQSFLCLNENLLSKKGFHYLKTARMEDIGGAHHPLAWMLLHKHSKDYSSTKGNSFVGKLERVCRDLELELKSISEKSIIISTEVFPILGGEAIDELVSLFPNMSVKAVFYVRDLYSQSLSLASQIIKIQESNSDVSISNLYAHISYFYKYYKRCLNLWVKKIGKENLIFKKYGTEYFKYGNIYADFLDAVGLDFTNEYVLPSKRANDSLIYCETIYFKDIINKLRLRASEDILVDRLIEWEISNNGTRFYFTKELSAKLEKDISSTHKYLLDNYLDESFEKLFKKQALVTENHDFQLSYAEFRKMLDYIDFQIVDFKNNYFEALKKVLDRTYEYEIKAFEFEDKLNNLIKNSNAVAVWGCGDVADRLFRKHDFFKSANCFVVDNNNEKQGTIFWGHLVLSPAAIIEKGINTVIITSFVYADDIYNEIIRKYQNVKKIIKVSGLHTQIGMECMDC